MEGIPGEHFGVLQASELSIGNFIRGGSNAPYFLYSGEMQTPRPGKDLVSRHHANRVLQCSRKHGNSNTTHGVHELRSE